MTGATDLARMVPGFDFLQGLLKNAGAGLPNMGQWVAPTLNPEELDKRIQELKTVQFWLEQNAKLLATTIQAMEVQRMTLATLQTMNLPLADIGNALRLKPLAAAQQAEAAPAAPAATAAAKPRRPAAKKAAAAPAAVDPLQWWGALTQQFTELATHAVKDTAVDATKNLGANLAGALVKQGMASAGNALKKATARAPAAASKRKQ
jgi:hypothetical protein